MPKTWPDKTISVAPMMDWTDRHDRFFLRQIAPSVRLYTEMITTGALIHGDRARFLAFDPAEHPVALQLGGADPDALAEAASMGADWGYDEINLNCGCPSDRVQKGRFGACLMAEPALIRDCVAAMQDAVRVPVTVKTRIGIDDQDDLDFLLRFVDAIVAGGGAAVIIHARKAWLSGLSPKENREVPPLRYDRAMAVKAAFPDLPVILNGGLSDAAQVGTALPDFDGVMVGRAAYQNPWLLASLEQQFLGGTPAPDRHSVVRRMLPYIEERLAAGVPLKAITRHMLGLFQGVPGARAWRRTLSEEAVRPGAGPEVVLRALACVPEPLAHAA